MTLLASITHRGVGPCLAVEGPATRDVFETYLERVLAPVGMIFVRSKDGISHNPAEWSSQQDCAAGANVLYRTVLDLANA